MNSIKTFYIYFRNAIALVIICVVCSMMLITSLRAESNGWFIGANMGGSLATSASYRKNNDSNSGSIMLSTGMSIGIRSGYQAFFAKNKGVRFYLSGVTAFGVYPDTVNVENSDIPIVLDFYILGDINADYLYNWSDGQNFGAGFFVGFFGGTLIGIPLKNPNPTASNSVGVTAGINLGIRTIINMRHQIEFGVKVGMALFFGTVTDIGGAAQQGQAGALPGAIPGQAGAAMTQGTENLFTNVGAIMYAGAGYTYKF